MKCADRRGVEGEDRERAARGPAERGDEAIGRLEEEEDAASGPTLEEFVWANELKLGRLGSLRAGSLELLPLEPPNSSVDGLTS